MASVELKQVFKSYDGKHNVIHGIDLQIQHGEFVVFVGPSGCGKSTLLRMVAGLESITDGEITIDGKRVNEVHPRHRDIAMVFQDYALYPHKTLYEKHGVWTPVAQDTRRRNQEARDGGSPTAAH